MAAQQTSSSASGPSAAAADERSREQVLAEREAAREAKKAAKAAKAAKADKKGGDGAGKGQSSSAVASNQSKDSASRPGGKAAPQEQNSAQAAASSASRKQGTLKAASQSPSDAGTLLKSASATREARDPMRPPRIAGGANLFSNVTPAKSAREIRQLVVSASLSGDIHPSVLQLVQHLASFRLVGADARAIAVLQALRDFVLDYKVPPGETLRRDLIAKLKPQIEVLQQARPLGVSVVHAIRYLNFEVSNTNVDFDEQEAKAHIIERIEHFVRDRITYATQAIAAKLAQEKIRDGDAILTFGKSSVVEKTLLEAKRRGIAFSVIVIDARPHCEGRRLLAALEKEGISCTYGLVTSLTVLAKRATLCLLGTASLLGNGSLYARCGTSACAMATHGQGVPVIVCCETYKFSEQIRLDAYSLNEAGPPTALLTCSQKTKDKMAASASEWEAHMASSQAKTLPSLLNLVYDITPPRFVTAVASEVGFSTPESVGVILRDYKSVLYVQ